MKKSKKIATTLGELRQIINGLPDDTLIFPDWNGGPPGDEDPAVIVHGFVVRSTKGGHIAGPRRPYLSVLVSIQYLYDFEAEENGEDD